MVIQLRGTSGSGKTHLAREIMEAYEPTPRVLYWAGRKRPIAYVYNRPRESYARTKLCVLGAYESVCGGVDNINEKAQVAKLIRSAVEHNHDVLFEGLLWSEDFRYTLALHEDKIPVTVFSLTTPLELCIKRINKRRRTRNPKATDVNPKNTTVRVARINSAIRRLREHGVQIHEVPAKEALYTIKSLLGLALSE
jgi:hypothetical protein